MNADEIMKLPLDQFILLCQGLPPYIGVKNVYYEDPIFKSRLLPPAFTTREEALKAAASTVAKLNKRRWFDHGETRHSVEMSDEDISSMWDKIGDLYDEPEETSSHQPDDDEFTSPPDTANFLT
jgi:type IV secretory pathway TraG/TraD family ATPase VirD4